jgi:hypothetical protein
MAATARIAAFAAILAVAAPACGTSSASEAASICSDLMNLRATVAVLESPPPNATVGEVRGDIEKLDSTVGAVAGSSAVPESVGNEFEDARDAYRDVFDGIGDDDPFSSVADEAAAPARRLGAAYDAAVAALACGRSPSADAGT